MFISSTKATLYFIVPFPFILHIKSFMKIYPQFFIDKYIKNYLSKLFVSKGSFTLLTKNKPCWFFLFLWRLGPVYKNVYIPYCSLKVVYQSKKRIPNVFNFKDNVNTMLSPHIVYKCVCVLAATQLIMAKHKDILF